MARPKTAVCRPPVQAEAVIYARVSTKEQSDEGYSIDAQLALLREYACRNGLSVSKEYVESESAKSAGRKAFNQMLKDVKALGISVVLCEKTDRLYRNIADFAKVDDLDVAIHLVKENEIVSKDSKSHQRLVHGIKVLIARNYSENLGEEAKKGMREKAKQGVWPTKAPLGYLNVSVGSRRVIEPDPERHGHVTWMFRRYAEGDVSLKTLRDEAAARGLTTRKGRTVQTNEVHNILRHVVYTGVVKWADVEVPGIHEPLIDHATFLKVQDIMEGRNQTKAKPAAARDFLYTGLFTCGVCGCQISAQTTKGHRYYACSGAKGCPRHSLREETITEAIATKLSGMAIRADVLDLLKQALREFSDEEADFRKEEVGKLRSRQDELSKNLQRLYKDHLGGEVSKIVYTELRTQWELELVQVESMLAAYTKAKGKSEDEGVALLEFASNAYSRFKTSSREDQREMAKNLLSNSTVTDRKVQVRFHEAFEMILEANQETLSKGAETLLSEKWLPD